MKTLLSNKSLLACITIIILAIITGLVVLSETGHDSSAFHWGTLLGGLFLNLAAAGGIAIKLSGVGDKADLAATKAADLTEVAKDTNYKLTNGHIGEKLDEWLRTRGLAIIPSPDGPTVKEAPDDAIPAP